MKYIHCIVVVTLILLFNTLLFGDNVINNKNDILTINKFLIFESEYNEGAFLDVDPLQSGFKNFDGDNFPQENQIVKRMYTIRTTFKVNENLKNENLALYMGITSYARSIYLNGRLLYKQGRYHDDYNASQFISSRIDLPKDLLNYGDKPNDLGIQIFVQYIDAPLGDITISSYDNVTKWVFWRNFVNINIVQGASLIALILIFYFIFLYFTHNRANIRDLYFALLCLGFILSYINITFCFDSNNMVVLEKIAKSGFFILLISMALFTFEFTGIFRKSIIAKLIISIPSLVCIGLIIIQPTRQDAITIFNNAMLIIIAPGLLFIMVMLIVSTIRSKKKEEVFLLASFVITLFTAVSDIYFITIHVIPYVYLLQYGYFSLLISIFYILAIGQAHVYRDSIQKAVEIKELNVQLTGLNEQLTEQKNAFFRFVPTQFLELLGKSSAVDIKLGDNQLHTMSILFSDIRQFTNLSESMTPEKSFAFLNNYFLKMEAAIRAQFGFVDKYIGDAIMALFSDLALSADEKKPGKESSGDMAVAAAIGMGEEIKSLNAYFKTIGDQPINVGIGINTGLLILGTVGTETRLDTTVIGDAVNTASRLENLTQLYKVRIIISDSTLSDITDTNKYMIRKIDTVRAKGKNKPVGLYEVFNNDDPAISDLKLETIPLLEQSIELYKNREFKAAEEKFMLLHKKNQADSLPAVYVSRCRHFINQPPAPDWDGVFLLLQK